MKNKIFLYLLLILSIILPVSYVIAETSPNSVAATVNGKKIYVKDLDATLSRNPAMAMYWSAAQKNPKLINRMRRFALDKEIEKQLLLTAAIESKSIEPAVLKQKVDEFLAQYG
ncbi:MAG: hypothetical protein D6719_10740, partial [Candidatus Dadabacteria bacterium]